MASALESLQVPCTRFLIALRCFLKPSSTGKSSHFFHKQQFLAAAVKLCWPSICTKFEPQRTALFCAMGKHGYIYIYMYNICIYIYNISILSHVPDQEALPLQTWLQNIFKKWRLVQVARMDLDLARTFCWCPMQHLSLQIRANQHLLEGEQP